MRYKAQSSSIVAAGCEISDGVEIWNYSQLRENVHIGENTIIGSYVYIDKNVSIGKNCKIQNRALLYDSARIHDGVFIGPGAILTNDKNPRSVSSLGSLKDQNDWEKVGVEVSHGASIGAGAICVAPVTIGKWSLVGAGSIVTRNVRNYALVIGNPARQVGWVGPAGSPLKQISEVNFECPKTLTRFEVINTELHEIIL